MQHTQDELHSLWERATAEQKDETNQRARELAEAHFRSEYPKDEVASTADIYHDTFSASGMVEVETEVVVAGATVRVETQWDLDDLFWSATDFIPEDKLESAVWNAFDEEYYDLLVSEYVEANYTDFLWDAFEEVLAESEPEPEPDHTEAFQDAMVHIGRAIELLDATDDLGRFVANLLGPINLTLGQHVRSLEEKKTATEPTSEEATD